MFFDFVMRVLSLNSSAAAQVPERALHLPNYLQGTETICSWRKNKSDPEIEIRLLHRHFLKKCFTAKFNRLLLLLCSFHPHLCINRARARFHTHVICHSSPLRLFLPSHRGWKKNTKKCCLHPPSLSLSLSSKIILKSASTVQRRRRGRTKRNAPPPLLLPNIQTHRTSPDSNAVAHFGFQSCHGGFAGSFGNFA